MMLPMRVTPWVAASGWRSVEKSTRCDDKRDRATDDALDRSLSEIRPLDSRVRSICAESSFARKAHAARCGTPMTSRRRLGTIQDHVPAEHEVRAGLRSMTKCGPSDAKAREVSGQQQNTDTQGLGSGGCSKSFKGCGHVPPKIPTEMQRRPAWGAWRDLEGSKVQARSRPSTDRQATMYRSIGSV